MGLFKCFLGRKVEAAEAVGEVRPPPEPIHVLGVDERGEKYGVFKGDRVHMAVFGFTGVGKSRFLLSLILQHVRRGEGFTLIDPHGDLVRLVLTHIPPELRERVVYVDPMSAFKYGRVVQLNFLEYKGGLDRDLVARTFTDGLMKIYGKFWGPRLDMILLNALYALLEAGNARLTDLYHVIADEEFRESLLLKVTDVKVRTFWREEFKRMPRDASTAVLTKIYRLVQERILVPMFECDRSSIDFRQVMDEGKIMLVNLSEGALTSDVANFLGSMILARIYLAGMSRENLAEEERKPYYVYVDEAHRFTSSSLKDMLEALRKYHVYLTLASQHLDQYVDEVRDAIPNLCDTLVCFSLGEKTARRLEEFYTPTFTYKHIVHLPRHWFLVSAMVKGRRETMALKCVDPGMGNYHPEEAVKASLETYGRKVEVSHLAKKAEELPSAVLDTPYMTPAEWLILTKLYHEGGRQHVLEERELFRKLLELGVTMLEAKDALNVLSYRNYVTLTRREAEVRRPLPGGLYERRRQTLHYYQLTGHGVGLLEQIPRGSRGGLPDHIQMIGEVFHQLAREGYFCLVDTADEVGKKKPDILVYPPERVYDKQGRFRGVHPKNWDTPHRFAVEVETDPGKHPQRVISNWEKCRNLGLPVLFIARSLEDAKRIYGLLVNTTASIVKTLPAGKPPGTVSIGIIDEGVKLFIPEAGKAEMVKFETPEKARVETVQPEEARRLFGPLPPLGVKVSLPAWAAEKFNVKEAVVDWKDPSRNLVALRIGQIVWEVPAERLMKTEDGWQVQAEPETEAETVKVEELGRAEEEVKVRILPEPGDEVTVTDKATLNSLGAEEAESVRGRIISVEEGMAEIVFTLGADQRKRLTIKADQLAHLEPGKWVIGKPPQRKAEAEPKPGHHVEIYSKTIMEKLGVRGDKALGRIVEISGSNVWVEVKTGSAHWSRIRLPASQLIPAEPSLWIVKAEEETEHPKPGDKIEIPSETLQSFGVKISGITGTVEARILAASPSQIQAEIKHGKLTVQLQIPAEKIARKNAETWTVTLQEAEAETVEEKVETETVKPLPKPQLPEPGTTLTISQKHPLRNYDIQWAKLEAIDHEKGLATIKVLSRQSKRETLLAIPISELRKQPDGTWTITKKEAEKETSKLELITQLYREGWHFRIKEKKDGRKYLTAYKKTGGKLREKGLGLLTEELKKLLKRLEPEN